MAVDSTWCIDASQLAEHNLNQAIRQSIMVKCPKDIHLSNGTSRLHKWPRGIYINNSNHSSSTSSASVLRVYYYQKTSFWTKRSVSDHQLSNSTCLSLSLSVLELSASFLRLRNLLGSVLLLLRNPFWLYNKGEVVLESSYVFFFTQCILTWTIDVWRR